MTKGFIIVIIFNILGLELSFACKLSSKNQNLRLLTKSNTCSTLIWGWGHFNSVAKVTQRLRAFWQRHPNVFKRERERENIQWKDVIMWSANVARLVMEHTKIGGNILCSFGEITTFTNEMSLRYYYSMQTSKDVETLQLGHR